MESVTKYLDFNKLQEIIKNANTPKKAYEIEDPNDPFDAIDDELNAIDTGEEIDEQTTRTRTPDIPPLNVGEPIDDTDKPIGDPLDPKANQSLRDFEGILSRFQEVFNEQGKYPNPKAAMMAAIKIFGHNSPQLIQRIKNFFLKSKSSAPASHMP